MERESFEDDEVAALLNEHFVAIKVDREERPDIDHIYMTVCQALTGQGGWPLTIVMTPEQEPFFAGTYYPKHRKYGRIGLMELLTQILEKWAQDRDRLKDSGRKIADYLQRASAETTQGTVDEALLHSAYESFKASFDAEFGGFGDAPKFPTPHNLLFLLRYGTQFAQPEAIRMAERTLQAMYAGGLYDHVGFGFARYSTDRQWLVPHFEKMLYDNALLAFAYLEGFQVTQNATYAQVVRDIFTYVLRDMTHPEGGFYSAEDADSEGVEGKFYLWTRNEVRAVLGDERGGQYCGFYDVTQNGNFEGSNIPNLIYQSAAVFDAQQDALAVDWLKDVRQMNAELFDAREKRIHPHKDDKVLTAWNGLMIAAMARSGRFLHADEFVHAAERASAFVDTHLTQSDGRLLARFRDGESAHLGYVDDYAFLIWGYIELYEATGAAQWLNKAVQLQRKMLSLFWDDKCGGFFFTGHDSESLIARPKEIYDGAIPSGNSVASLNLLRLARMTADEEFSERALTQLNTFASEADRYPAGHTFYLLSVLFATGKSSEIVLSGETRDQGYQEMLDVVRSAYLPFSVLLVHPVDENQPDEIAQLAPFVQNQGPIGGKPTVYICENYACEAPITDVRMLKERLQVGTSHG